MILSCNHISKSYGIDTILDDCSFFVNDNEKAAIVGNNGAGKSTMMKIIMGELSADEGTVTLGKDKTIGYLAQYQDLSSHNSIYDEVKSVKQNLIDRYVMLLQIKAAETAINKQLDIQLAITKVKLSSYNIDIESIEKMILEN